MRDAHPVRSRATTPAIRPWNGDCSGDGTIHILAGQALGWSALFTSTDESRDGARSFLTRSLLAALAQSDPRWNVPAYEDTITLKKSPLGKPCLVLGGTQGPALSFSHGQGRLWAAMSSIRDVGIDVAYPEDFDGAYPFERAFRPEERECARDLCPDDMARGAALIWSAKEAAVKATGEGFNFIDPLAVRVGSPQFREDGVLFDVWADRPVAAWARTEGRGWLSLAWLSEDQEEAGSMTTLRGGSPSNSPPTKRTASSARSNGKR